MACFSGANAAAMTPRGVEELLTTSRLLSNPVVNISHHIMRQALEHEAACGSLGSSDKVEAERRQKRVEEGKKGTVNDWQD